MTTSTSTRLTYVKAVNEALRWALDTYPEALIFGEDVAIPGGVWGATRGLRDEFGDRVFDTPISESAIVGAAIGSAMRGRRPIVEIMWIDFAPVAMDQLVNQLPNIHYGSAGKLRAPVTIRTQQGHTPGSTAQHSQCLEAFFAHVPGLRVGLPGNPQDAYDMLRSAIASDDPVMIIECRGMYQDEGSVELGRPVEPIGGARVVRTGEHVTLVSWSRMVKEALGAADILMEQGISAEIIDLRWVSPLDFGTVAQSLERTGVLAIAHEATITGGFGAELAARAAGEGFWNLNAPVLRIGTPDIRIPSAVALQQAVIPNATAIAAAVRQVVEPTLG